VSEESRPHPPLVPVSDTAWGDMRVWIGPTLYEYWGLDPSIIKRVKSLIDRKAYQRARELLEGAAGDNYQVIEKKG
jgi:hypothetical protein